MTSGHFRLLGKSSQKHLEMHQKICYNENKLSVLPHTQFADGDFTGEELTVLEKQHGKRRRFQFFGSVAE